MTTTVHPATKHPRSYYFRALQIIVTAKGNYHCARVVALLLNNAGVLAPSGNQWTIQAVTSLLKRVRGGQGPFYLALLQAVVSGHISRDSAELLTCLS